MTTPTSPFAALQLPIRRARLTLRLLEDTTLPAYKGAMLRGGFGYAIQRIACPPPCHGAADSCPVRDRCTYHRIFEPMHPSHTAALHDLRDAPRAFVLRSPPGAQTSYQAGETLEFGLMLVGNAIDELPHFILGFEQFGRIGLGRHHAPARLERVEVLQPWQPTGTLVYADGQARNADAPLPTLTTQAVIARAEQMPSDLTLELHTPLRIKTHGTMLRRFELAPLVQSICWRLNALALFYGEQTEPISYRTVVEQAQRAHVAAARVRWDDWQRTSTRGPEPQTMPMGGLVGSVELRDVSSAVRAALLLGSLVGVGKGATFGLGEVRVINSSI